MAERLDRDVLGVSGITDVIFHVGTNWLHLGRAGAQAETLDIGFFKPVRHRH